MSDSDDYYEAKERAELNDMAWDEVRDKLTELIEENKHLKVRLEAADALIEHARHDEGCSASLDERYTCKCGYNKAKVAYDELKQKEL